MVGMMQDRLLLLESQVEHLSIVNSGLELAAACNCNSRKGEGVNNLKTKICGDDNLAEVDQEEIENVSDMELGKNPYFQQNYTDALPDESIKEHLAPSTSEVWTNLDLSEREKELPVYAENPVTKSVF